MNNMSSRGGKANKNQRLKKSPEHQFGYENWFGPPAFLPLYTDFILTSHFITSFGKITGAQ
jgi:hypothetical protein